MRFRSSGFLAWVLILFLTGCEKPEEFSFKIDRPEQDEQFRIVEGQWTELEGGKYRARYFVDRYVFADSSASADPFADPATNEARLEKPAKEVLEDFGVTFGDGASAFYDRNTRVLTVTQTAPQLELVEAVLDSFHVHYETMCQLRAEIYRVPRLLGIEVMESMREYADHTPERDALFNAAMERGAELLAAPALLCRSGVRSETTESIAGGGMDNQTDGDESAAGQSPARSDLLKWEVYPTIGADDYTLEVACRLTVAAPKPTDLQRTLTTQTVMHDNTWVFLGNWNYSDEDEMILVFLTASLQRLFDPHGSLLKEDASSPAPE